MKSAWRGLFSQNLWCKILLDKYLRGANVEEWVQKDASHAPNASIIRRGILDVIPIINKALIWQVGIGTSIRMGIDCFFGGEKVFRLSEQLIMDLQSKGYSTLAHISTGNDHLGGNWRCAYYLRL